MTKSSSDKEIETLLGMLISLVEKQNRILEEHKDIMMTQKEYLHTIDWKLWETYKVHNSKAIAENLEIVEPFNVDRDIK